MHVLIQTNLTLQIGDLVEAIEDQNGAWFEGTIVNIIRNLENSTEPESELAGDINESDQSPEEILSIKMYAEDPTRQDDGLLYMVSFDL